MLYKRQVARILHLQKCLPKILSLFWVTNYQQYMTQLLQFTTFHTHLATQLHKCIAHTLSDEELFGLPTNNLAAKRHFSIFSGLAETAKFRNKGFNTEEGNDAKSELAAKARTPKNDMEEAGGREFEESLVA